MGRTLATVVALSAALVLGPAPDVAGAATKASSTVTITKAESVPGGTFIKGKVTSGKPACKKHRKVSVYHDVAPPGLGSEDFLLDIVETNNRGRWRLTTVFAVDKVYAKVKGTRDCKRDRSSIRTVAP